MDNKDLVKSYLDDNTGSRFVLIDKSLDTNLMIEVSKVKDGDSARLVHSKAQYFDSDEKTAFVINNEQYDSFKSYLDNDALLALEYAITLIPKPKNFKINILNKDNQRTSTTINYRLAEAYLKICTNKFITPRSVRNEIQRIAYYDTYKDLKATDNESLMEILISRIEDKLLA